MAAKIKTVFFCQNCGNESSKWMGQCPACKEWNTMVEETVRPESKTGRSGASAQSRTERVEPQSLSDILMEEEERADTHMEELNRVLGGGLVRGSLTLVGGDPGIGKSTLLLQVARNMSADGRKMLYISGEESLRQIKIRANRIGSFSQDLRFLCETNLDTIEEVIRHTAPEIVIIDSIQTMYSEAVSPTSAKPRFSIHIGSYQLNGT